LADEEKAYATIQRFLADPKHSTYLSDEERREFTGAISELRKKRDDVRAIREQRPRA